MLSTFASVAVAVIGFAGLLAALRTASAPLSRADMVNIRILLIFSLGALLFSLVPLPLSHLTAERLWPPLTIVLAAFLLLWPIRSPFWYRARGIRPRRPVLYWSILATEAVIGSILMARGLSGAAGGSDYLFGVGWCLLVAIVTFVAQVFSLLAVDQD